MFSFPFIVAFVSSVFWIFPAIRNYKTKLFLYFLVLAVSDPVGIIVVSLFKGLSTAFYVFFALLLVASLKVFFSSQKLYLTILTIFFLMTVAVAFSPVNIRYIASMIEHIVVAFIFIGILLSYVAMTSKVKGYHIILVLYEISIILKILFIILNVELGLGYFYTTTIFQMLIAVYFSVYKETDNKLLIDLKNV
ncbi:MAG: hypothetical protein M1495_21545 [Bacteroidetes bacterium]|nr:hypothetical protein [Bacteroidota bacterium]MCL6097353.1 hypothetical protein [Bacteroidota bacterium]